MAYRSLRQCLDDLARNGLLRQIDVPIDARLEAPAIHRRVCAAGGPALLFNNVVGCRFPLASNLFGTIERTRFMFRDSLEAVQRLVSLKATPHEALRHPTRYWRAPLDALKLLPKRVGAAPVLEERTTVSQLPPLTSWPRDGGPFVTLPIVYTEDVRAPGFARSNLGMYRVQLSGNQYAVDREVGIHYQIHRSIGVHHAAAIRAGKPFRVVVNVGGPPSLSVAAVMPLPEGMSELGFAGVLGGRRVRMAANPDGVGLPLLGDCDFAISGVVEPDRLLSEGPFGDHLGYYSLVHPFPVLKVDQVYCRRDAVWPFTVVGRPPQEDTVFGKFIHELSGPVIPTVLPGIVGVHAVDAAGVHPLLLAIGNERYMPFLATAQPQELLTQASAILGQGQLSLAKFLLIASHSDDPMLDLDDIPRFFRHILERADWRRDLHFHTQTTIDTLDYSGRGLNAGSKLVIAAAGPPRFDLATELPSNFSLPDGFRNPRIVLPGVLAIAGPPCPKPSFDFDASLASRDSMRREAEATIRRFLAECQPEQSPIRLFRLIVIVDDSQFVAESFNNFLWAVFTRTNPADDAYGIDEFFENKHWGCRGPLVLDARIKPHHAPLLEEDPATTRRIEQLAATGGPLAGLF